MATSRMSAGLRIAIMVVVSEITLILIGGGVDPEGMATIGGYVLFFCTLPLILIMAIFHRLQTWLGAAGALLIALVGLLPTAFVFLYAPANGIVTDGLAGYSGTLCAAGWLWSAAWLLTTDWRIASRR